MMGNLRDVEKVGRAATHQFAHLIVVVKTRWKTHIFFEKAHSYILFDFSAHKMSDGGHIISAPHLDYFHAYHQSRHFEKTCPHEFRAQNIVQQIAHENGKNNSRNRHHECGK